MVKQIEIENAPVSDLFFELELISGILQSVFIVFPNAKSISYYFVIMGLLFLPTCSNSEKEKAEKRKNIKRVVSIKKSETNSLLQAANPLEPLEIRM